ncbi:flagellar hook-basal body complex protein FliE [Noviherbaspirillum galbum]|uniref:Flagellar hook-basal body complex protein FliE n=1 Tax=Noviherbaspirillum galbum TaxID=2709383 RepID=A0A6B3SXZ0_9BURK|nr:flagellar hook-basal body complex protein FliE [Noviherbaspirillum galbum]NEX62699.1 flagellar hook-basal body complex protein FliE [Noviherbaspirillum galbum]
MKTGGIDSSRIEAMLAQLKAAATRPGDGVNPLMGAAKADGAAPAGKVDFSNALKVALDQVNGTQLRSEELGKRFVSGDDSVNLSDVMISAQKANISFQATVQVRNRLVSAYHDIMNMQV